MKIIDFSETNSILNQYVSEIRNVEVQNDRLRFRRNIERIGEIMAYEISKSLNYAPRTVTTPLGTCTTPIVSDQVVLGTILRAGLPFHAGFLNTLDLAENSFVSAYRKYKDKLNFDINIEYIASPALDDKVLILTDPMLATGSSMELSYRALLTKGTPSHVHIASIIASQQAVDYILEHFDHNTTTLWVAAIDPLLDEHQYIIPGLGDAGDLAYGAKL